MARLDHDRCCDEVVAQTTLLRDVLAGIRTTADGKVDGSVPAGFGAWQPPARVVPAVVFSATYHPPGTWPLDPEPPSRSVTVSVTDNAGFDPFADPLRSAHGDSPAEQPRLVDVDGRPGVWYDDDRLTGQCQLVRRAGAGVTMSVSARRCRSL